MSLASAAVPITTTFLEPRTWWGVLLGLCAFPAFFASTIFRLIGQRIRADALATWTRRSWLGRDSESGQGRPAWKPWAALAVSLGVFVVTAYLVTGIVINLAYPLRPDSKPTDWGGPSLMGRWMAHGAGGIVFAIATPIICGRLRALAARVL